MNRSKRTIVANWKMHGSLSMARDFLEVIAQQSFAAGVEIVICPPATLLYEMAHQITGLDIRVGAQDCHAEKEGAFTGDISAAMLKDAGCGYVIVGHSERRSQHGETSALVKKKAQAALDAGLVPIICIGETLAERQAGRAKEIVGQQLRESLPEGDFILAYEPVWAIGSGLAATSDDISDMHTYIVSQTHGAHAVLYGGSVKAANAREILTIAGVSGVLVGGASLKAEEFCKIIAAA